MFKKLSKVINFHPYPVEFHGRILGYRCFDGERWRECDQDGKIIK